MERERISRRLVICTTSVFFFLILTLYQDSLFSISTFNSWQQSSWTRRTDLLPEEAELIKLQLRRLVRDENELESTGVSCTSEIHSEVCVINKPVIFDKRSLTMYIPSDEPNPPVKRVVRPYPRRDDQSAMDGVAPFNILQGNISNNELPECQFRHNAPAVVFSFGGFSHNNFHAFNEIIVPLFITSRNFERRVEFVIVDYRARWIRKFSQVLKKLTDYDLVDADSDDTVHCFPAAVVGLRYHDNLAVNNTEIPRGHTMESFKQFLRDTYNLKIKTINQLKHKKPKLLLLSRKESRRLLNEDEMVNMMEKLGFQVQKALPSETSYLDKISHIVNSCDVMVGLGVHGAGLTNQVFLPNGSVLVQIVPLGQEWASEHYFARPAVGMGLKYLDYKVHPNETSIYGLYGPNSRIISDPRTVWAKGYRVVKNVYFDHQDFRIDLVRFKGTLLQVLKLLG